MKKLLLLGVSCLVAGSLVGYATGKNQGHKDVIYGQDLFQESGLLYSVYDDNINIYDGAGVNTVKELCSMTSDDIIIKDLNYNILFEGSYEQAMESIYANSKVVEFGACEDELYTTTLIIEEV